jgi:hypothetical protein
MRAHLERDTWIFDLETGPHFHVAVNPRKTRTRIPDICVSSKLAIRFSVALAS